MAVNKCYNKYSDTYYAYEITYEWDEAQQKKVRHKRCVGHFDPVTGELVPNGTKGKRQPDKVSAGTTQEKAQPDARKKEGLDPSELKEIAVLIDQFVAALAKNCQNLSDDIHRIAAGTGKKKSRAYNSKQNQQEKDAGEA